MWLFFMESLNVIEHVLLYSSLVLTALMLIALIVGALAWYRHRDDEFDGTIFIKDASIELAGEMRSDIKKLKSEIAELHEQRDADRQRIIELYVGVMLLIGQLREAGIAPAWEPSGDVWAQGTAGSGGRVNYVSLAHALENVMTPSDLTVLIYDIGLKPDNFQGETHSERVRRFVVGIEQLGKEDELLARLAERRPHIKWSVLAW